MNKKKAYKILSFYLLCSSAIFIPNCAIPINTINLNKIENTKNLFSTKSTSSTKKALYLPFNSYYCNCESESVVNLTYSARDYGGDLNQSFGGNQGITISQNGEINIGISDTGGWLYGPSNTFTIVSKAGNIGSTFENSISTSIDTTGEPCKYGASHKGGPAAGAYVSPTYYLKSGSLNLSIEENDLVARVSGITSDKKAFWTAPWDGSCRVAEHLGQITTGNATIRFKNVVRNIQLDLEGEFGGLLGVAFKNQSTNQNVLQSQSTLKVTPSDKNSLWTLSIEPKNNNGCSNSNRIFTGKGDQMIKFPPDPDPNNHNYQPESDYKNLATGEYDVKLYYAGESWNYAEGSIKLGTGVDMKIDIDADIPVGSYSRDKSFSNQKKIAKTIASKKGQTKTFGIAAQNCPQWDFKLAGVLENEQSCEINFSGTGNGGHVFDGKCKGGYFKDGVYQGTLTQGGKSQSEEAYIDNTPPTISNIFVDDMSISVQDPVVNGASSELNKVSIKVFSKNGENISERYGIEFLDHQGYVPLFTLKDELENKAVEVEVTAEDNVGNISVKRFLSLTETDDRNPNDDCGFKTNALLTDSLSIESKDSDGNKTDLISPKNKDEKLDYLNLDIKTPKNCNTDNWQLEVKGNKSLNDTNEKGEECTWSTSGTGDQTIKFEGKCNDGSYMADGKYNATLSLNSNSISKEIKIDNTPPILYVDYEKSIVNSDGSVNLSIKLYDPEINGVKSGMDENTFPDPNKIVSLDGQKIAFNISNDGTGSALFGNDFYLANFSTKTEEEIEKIDIARANLILAMIEGRTKNTHQTQDLASNLSSCYTD